MSSGPELLQAHVRAFNDGVRTGDWEPMLGRFAAAAELRFENAPAGPFSGLEAIRKAPTASSHQTTRSACSASRSATSTRPWLRSRGRRAAPGGSCSTHDRGEITALTVIFD